MNNKVKLAVQIGASLLTLGVTLTSFAVFYRYKIRKENKIKGIDKDIDLIDAGKIGIKDIISKIKGSKENE